jgi:hypothetical protein
MIYVHLRRSRRHTWMGDSWSPDFEYEAFEASLLQCSSEAAHARLFRNMTETWITC